MFNENENCILCCRIVDDVGAISLGKSILISLARVDGASIGQLLERILAILFTCVKRNSAFVLIGTLVLMVFVDVCRNSHDYMEVLFYFHIS